MLEWSQVGPTVQNIVSGLLGFGTLGWVLWQVLRYVKIDNHRDDLAKEAKEDRSSLRRRNAELEAKINDLQDRLIESSSAASGASSCVAQMQRTIINQEHKITELEAEIKIAESAFDDAEAKTENYRIILAQAKFFLDGCKGCQHTDTLHMLRRELPKYIVKDNGDPLLLVSITEDLHD